MDSRTIETFIHTAESGSFSKAALRLNYAQSTVTSQIKALEKELGVELFTRTGKKVSLSNAGRLFLQYAYNYRSLTTDVYHRFNSESRPIGPVRLGLLESIAASPFMNTIYSFLHDNPKINITLIINTVGEIKKLLLQGDLDFAIILDDAIIHSSIIPLYTKKTPIIFFASDQLYLPAQPIKLLDLSKYPWILTEKGFNYRRKLEEVLQSKKQYIVPRLEVGSTQAVIQAVEKNLGISLLPEFDLNDAFLTHKIIPIVPIDYTMDMDLQVLTLKGHWLSPATTLLINYLIDAL